MIDTREELFGALQAAAELEHGLMVQYLFAGMSLRTEEDNELTSEESEAIARWREMIYLVARQEMGHLGTVQNLLSILGAPALFSLPAFPVTSHYFNPPQLFTLEPLTESTISRFVKFEQPSKLELLDINDLQPDPLRYKTVGDLYRQISTALGALPEDELFIAPSDAQDSAAWSFDVIVHPTRKLEEARQAILQIVEEGEATSTGGPESHYQRFLEIQKEYLEFQNRNPQFRPYRNVISNPTTNMSATNRPSITHNSSRPIAELFNAVYKTLMLILSQVYKFQEQKDSLIELRMGSIGLMQGVLRPLGQEVLPELSASNIDDGIRAAAPFEIYNGSITVHWDRKVALKTIAERLHIEYKEAVNLASHHSKMPSIVESLDLAVKRFNFLIG